MSLVKTYPFDKILHPKDLLPVLTVARIEPSTTFSSQSADSKPSVKTFNKLPEAPFSTYNPYPYLYFFPTDLLILDWQDQTTYYNDVLLLDFQSVDPTSVVAITIHEHLQGGSITQLTGIYHYSNLSSLTIINQHELQTIVIPKLSLLTYVVVTFNGLTSLDISNNTYINHVDCSYNPLTDINIGGATSLNFFDGGVCELTEQSVNHILFELDEYGNVEGYIDLSGGTNAVPSGVGLTAIDNLLVKGWTIYTN